MGAQDREWNTALRSDPELVHLDCQTHFYNLPLYSTLCSRVKVGERDGSFVVGIACGLGTALFSTFRFSVVLWGISAVVFVSESSLEWDVASAWMVSGFSHREMFWDCSFPWDFQWMPVWLGLDHGQPILHDHMRKTMTLCYMVQLLKPTVTRHQHSTENAC